MNVFVLAILGVILVDIRGIVTTVLATFLYCFLINFIDFALVIKFPLRICTEIARAVHLRPLSGVLAFKPQCGQCSWGHDPTYSLGE